MSVIHIKKKSQILCWIIDSSVHNTLRSENEWRETLEGKNIGFKLRRPRRPLYYLRLGHTPVPAYNEWNKDCLPAMCRGGGAGGPKRLTRLQTYIQTV